MWPFSSPYPERRPEEVDGKTFDYIIVGGGCAGCVLASRLSEDAGVSVLVLEKGRVSDTFLSRIPLLSQNYRFTSLQTLSRLSEPIKEVGGRRARLWTAEAVGGATRVNGMLLTRGVPGGFNGWASEFGLADWSWEKVEPFFRKSENSVGHPGAAHRGHGGPVVNRQPPLAMGFYPYYEKAAKAVGLPVHQDLNDPAAPAQGYFYLDMTIDERSNRLSSYRAWLNKTIATERRERLAVCTGVIASKLEVDGKGKQVTGVYIRHAGPPSNKRDFFVKARREVIICSGSVCSPQLLMLSGIGPKDQVEGNGIPLVHELPAVGKNLADHCSVPVIMEVPLKDSLHQLETLLGILWHMMLYLLFGTGLLASSSTPASAFLRTTTLNEDTMTVQAVDGDGSTMDASDPRNVPDAEIMVTPINCLSAVVPGLSLSSFYPTLTQPFSRGRVELASTDAGAHPRIIYPMLEDKRDVIALRRVTRFAMHLAERFQASGYPHPAPVKFGPGMDLEYLEALYEAERDEENHGGTHLDVRPAPAGNSTPELKASANAKAQALKKQAQLRNLNWRDVTDRDIDEYAKRVCVTSLHFSSTCRMSLGPEDGVVDQRLKVHGLRNLRVADASVFPKIPSAHTMAPTVMVAERCAEFLKTEWTERKEK